MSERFSDFMMRQRWLWRLTGGRPMFRGKPLFRDAVSGDIVYHYTDRLGRSWMAEKNLSLFRVERSE